MAVTTPTKSPEVNNDVDRAQVVHYAAIAGVSVGIIRLCWPPFRINLPTVLAGVMAAGCGNHLTWEITGRSMGERISSRYKRVFAALDPSGLSPRASEVQQRIREEKAMATVKKLQEERATMSPREVEAQIDEEVRRRERESMGIMEKLWLGGEDRDWKEKRNKREKEALESGKSYGDLIADQVSEVWGKWRGKIEDVKEVDEKVVEEKKGEKKR